MRSATVHTHTHTHTNQRERAVSMLINALSDFLGPEHLPPPDLDLGLDVVEV